ncbi:MAG: hypothetical protein AAB588_05740 [Patescibacteria group bacterium]
MPEPRTCQNCQASFVVEDDDFRFYEKVKVPPPTLCVACRKQRRLAQGNHLFLYKRQCDATGKPIISNYAPNGAYKVFDQAYWHSDAWDGVYFGRDFDFNRSFFEQYGELSKAVPRPALQTAFHFDENSQYTNYAGKNKNCYLIFDSDENWDCYYSYSTNSSKSCSDCYRVKQCELCYECIDCENCYRSYFLQDCEQCIDSAYLKNCIGCKNCFMSSNLRHKEYYIQNQPVGKELYEEWMARLGFRSGIEADKKAWAEFALKFPQKFMHGTHNENVTGDYLVNCKNAVQCFDSRDLWDCKYFDQSFMDAKDCMDIQECGDKAELLYETAFSGYSVYNLKFCLHCLSPNRNLQYCNYCVSCEDCFGCIGLKRKKYCVLNKQYTKEEYESLLPKIIEQMKSSGEYGEFFPIQLSSFAYNETLAQDFYPLTKKDAVTQGYKWRDEEAKNTVAASVLPDSIDETEEDICDRILACEDCARNYAINKQEFTLMKHFLKVALPRKCFFCRHQARRAQRNPRRLWNRPCMKCGTEMKTSYAPERPEIVYCEKCYLEAVY